LHAWQYRPPGGCGNLHPVAYQGDLGAGWLALLNLSAPFFPVYCNECLWRIISYVEKVKIRNDRNYLQVHRRLRGVVVRRQGPVIEFKKFSDWAQLSAQAQYTVAITASARAKRFESRLRACVEIERPDVEPSTNHSLALIPYAAKDLFVAPKHRPKGGLADVLDFGLNDCADVLRRLDDAGACRVGFTAMTELAYEPSGYNAVSTYPRNPWNLDFITGGS
jgi:hypothetical protein